MDPALIKSALIRSTRTFIQTFIGFIGAVWIGASGVDGHRITGLWDTVTQQWDLAAGAALIAAVIAGGWRAVLDPSPVPSLKDETDTTP
jgi:hypothetical protein